MLIFRQPAENRYVSFYEVMDMAMKKKKGKKNVCEFC